MSSTTNPASETVPNTASNPIRTVGDIMTGDLVALSPVDPVSRARQILAASGLHALPIIDRGTAVGVVTLADCEYHQVDDPMDDVAQQPPITITTDASVGEAAALMRAEYVHHLLVTEPGATEVVGILSSFDLLATIT